MTYCVVIPSADKFAAVINGKLFGVSRHIDYWAHHQKLGDLKTLAALNITLFVHTDAEGKVTECIEAEALGKGKSYKTATRYVEQLDASALQLVAEAFALVHPKAEPAKLPVNDPAFNPDANTPEGLALLTAAAHQELARLESEEAAANDSQAVATAMGPSKRRKAK
jgi:hypothetical protein